MPHLFYDMEFSDFMSLRKGWDQKLLYEQTIARRMTMIIASAMVGGKNINVDELWPLAGDKTNKDMILYKGVMMHRRQVERLIDLKNKAKKNG